MAINPYGDRNKPEDPSKTMADISKAIAELSDMRDHIDTLMRALKVREERLVEDVEHLTSLAADVVGMKGIVRDSLSRLTERLTPTVAKRGSDHE